MQFFAAHGFLSRWFLRYTRRNGRRTPRVRESDPGVSRVLTRSRKRSDHAAPGNALPRIETRRPLVSARAALGRSVGSGTGAARRARSDQRESAGDRAARSAEAPRAGPALTRGARSKRKAV